MILRPTPPSAAAIFRLRLQYRSNSHFPPCAVSRIASHRHFTTTPNPSQQPHPTHYDILGVSPSVSPADLKKRFYVLSKENHPDLHPNSKEHTTKFQRISESYTVLANPEKRRKYDRDVMRMRPSVQGGSGSGSYAGSRPATGLSKRRSTFRGPPPSYFGNRANPSQSQSTSSESTSGGSSSAYAWGPEPQFAQTSDFNSQPIFRTQTAEDQRREKRNAAAAAAAQAAFDEEGDFWGRFVMVTVIVLVGVTVGTMLVGVLDTSPKGGGMLKGDGSLRRPEGGGKKKEGG